MRIRVLIPLLILLLVGVGLVWWSRATRPEPGTMLKSWSESIAKLGVRAVYPLQEGLFPGDILLVATYPQKGRADEKPAEFYSFYPIPVGSLDLCELYLSLKNSPEFQAVNGYVSKGSKPMTEATVTPWQPTEIRYSNFKCPNSTTPDFKLNRAVAFPAFQLGSVVESGVGGNLMAWMAGARGGAAGKDEALITVSIPNATVLRVPISALRSAWNSGNFDFEGGWNALQCLILDMMEIQTVTDKQGNRSKPELLLVSEVYYANAIDVSISNSTAQSAEIAVSTQALVDKFQQLTKLQDKLKALTAEAPQSHDTNSNQADFESHQSAVAQLSQQITETQAEVNQLSKAILPDAPGFTGSVKRVSSSGVTLTQVFPRPMAIGYRALGYGTGKISCPKPKSEAP